MSFINWFNCESHPPSLFELSLFPLSLMSSPLNLRSNDAHEHAFLAHSDGLAASKRRAVDQAQISASSFRPPCFFRALFHNFFNCAVVFRV